MCRGGTLPLRATCSIKANCPFVFSPVAKNVSSQPLYQTDCSTDCRPLPNATSSPMAVFSVRCSATTRSFDGCHRISPGISDLELELAHDTPLLLLDTKNLPPE